MIPDEAQLYAGTWDLPLAWGSLPAVPGRTCAQLLVTPEFLGCDGGPDTVTEFASGRHSMQVSQLQGECLITAGSCRVRAEAGAGSRSPEPPPPSCPGRCHSPLRPFISWMPWTQTAGDRTEGTQKEKKGEVGWGDQSRFTCFTSCLGLQGPVSNTAHETPPLAWPWPLATNPLATWPRA